MNSDRNNNLLIIEFGRFEPVTSKNNGFVEKTMVKNTTQREMSVQDAVWQMFSVAMESYTSTCVLCGVLAVVVYKIVSLYVRKSIDAKGTSVKSGDNEEESDRPAGDDDGVSEVADETSTNLSKNSCVEDKLNDELDLAVVPAGKGEMEPEEKKEPSENSRGGACHHSDHKRESFSEQLHVVNLLQGGVTAETLDTLQPPIEVCEWFTCTYQCPHTTYDLKVLLQDKHKRPIVEFYYGYDFSKTPKGICKKVSHTFKKYGPGVRYITFRHKIGKDVEVNEGEYGCKMSDGVMTVSRNKMT